MTKAELVLVQVASDTIPQSSEADAHRLRWRDSHYRSRKLATFFGKTTEAGLSLGVVPISETTIGTQKEEFWPQALL